MVRHLGPSRAGARPATACRPWLLHAPGKHLKLVNECSSCLRALGWRKGARGALGPCSGLCPSSMAGGVCAFPWHKLNLSIN